jgi:predicted phage terminase large subunit-like protein
MMVSLPRAEAKTFYQSIILNPYIPEVPYYTQVELLVSAFHSKYALFGGGRGGGKTSTLLMAALQFVSMPSWQAGVLRLTYKKLAALGAVMNRCRKWMALDYLEKEGIKPHWDNYNKIFTFPSGAAVQFGHVQYDENVEDYQGAEYHRLLFDEAVQFSEHKIIHLRGSVRKAGDDPLPVNVWYTGNPGGLSHDYFNTSFVKGDGLFIPSLYTDNPHLNHEDYGKILDDIAAENPILGRQWKYGDWEAVPEGKIFQRKWFTDNSYTSIDEPIVGSVRLWDLAATEEENVNKKGGADWTAGCLLLKDNDGEGYIDHYKRFRFEPDKAEKEIFKQIHEDYDERPKTLFRIEMEGGASPKYLVNIWGKKLPGYDFDGWKVPRKDKLERARAMVTFAKKGLLKMREDPDWNNDFLNEITSFPTKGVHDDMVDALSGAFNVLFMGEKPKKAFIGSVEMW